MKKILIAIPTYRRPDGLARLLDSLCTLDPIAGARVEVLIVENDQKKSVSSILSTFEKKSKIKTYYVLEKNRGLAYVRNRILKEAIALKADYLAGLDDDEFVSKGWLRSLWEGLQKYKATVATGPTLSVFDVTPPKWIIKGNFFAMGSTRPTGKILNRCATGNFLLDLAFVRKYNLSFDARFNFIGGEDIDFFNTMLTHKAKIVWVNEALVSESVPESRMTL
ncbi:MAG: glycosyltransferase family 2 protein, partial [Alphaproteobacteria bacterium]|nr:glycosyltransferase family 2 protein [Alphaproteobacteria bacterium]